MVAKEIMLVGVISILEGENPRLIEDKLKSFLSHKEQQETAAAAGSVQKKAALTSFGTGECDMSAQEEARRSM